MKSRWRKVASTLLVVILVISSVSCVRNFLQLKESKLRYSSFLTEKQNIDVLLIGSSHIRHDIYPMELWYDFGISAYNLGCNGSTLATSYWSLVNALDYQTPQVVILDVFDMWPGRLFSEYWGQVHQQFDVFPMSINKYRMINDLFSDKDATDGNGESVYEKRWDIFWDLGEYHTRWDDLTQEDFSSDKEMEAASRVWKGSSPLINVVDRIDRVYDNLTGSIMPDAVSTDYLNRIILLCREKNIELLLINTGFDCTGEAKAFHDSVNQIAMDNDLIYIDFTKESPINFDTDLYDSGHNTHLNFSGAEKLTKNVGAIIKDSFQLVDHRDDSAYAQWWDDYYQYEKSKQDYLSSQTDILNYFLLLNHDNYDVLINIEDDTVLEMPKLLDMINNLGVCYDGNSKFVYVNVGTYSCQFSAGDACKNFELSCGAILEQLDEDGNYRIYKEGKTIYTSDMVENSKISVIVFNKRNGELVDINSF